MLKILIVDDDVRIRKMIATVLFEMPAEIFFCDDGSKALDCYMEHRPDWVLMDLRMPGVDGIAATRMIKTSFPNAKVIILTSYESPAMRDAAHTAGAYRYVLKENLTDLRDIVSANGAGSG